MVELFTSGFHPQNLVFQACFGLLKRFLKRFLKETVHGSVRNPNLRGARHSCESNGTIRLDLFKHFLYIGRHMFFRQL